MMNKAQRIENIVRQLNSLTTRKVEMAWPEKVKNQGDAVVLRNELHILTKDLPRWFLPREVTQHLDGYF